MGFVHKSFRSWIFQGFRVSGAPRGPYLGGFFAFQCWIEWISRTLRSVLRVQRSQQLGTWVKNSGSLMSVCIMGSILYDDNLSSWVGNLLGLI